MPRNCIISADNVCYICGEVKSARQRKAITAIVKKAYDLYFGCKIGDQDKSWALHICCRKCATDLSQWLNGKRHAMPFVVPMVWREPSNHTTDCYFCMVPPVSGGVTKKKKWTIVYPILENGAACWEPHRECQIIALDRVQNKAAKFAHHVGRTEWESLSHRRRTASMCALYRAYTGERAWKDIRDRLQVTSYFSEVDHKWKIRTGIQRTDIGKYSFVKWSIADWNQLPKGTIGIAHDNAHKFKTRIRKCKPCRAREGVNREVIKGLCWWSALSIRAVNEV